MILEKAGPVLELVHDVPRCGHGHVDDDCCICNINIIINKIIIEMFVTFIILLSQGKVEKIGVRSVTIEDPV